MNRISMLLIADVIVTSCVVEDGALMIEKLSEPEPVGFFVTVAPFTRSGKHDAGKCGMPDDRMGGVAFMTGDTRWGDCFLSSVGAMADDFFAEPSGSTDNEFLSTGKLKPENTGFCSYFAYFPYCEDTEWEDGIEFSVDKDISSHTDLLYAGAIDQRADSPEVGLVFKHALSRIIVKARAHANENGHTVKVKSVTLGGRQDGEHFYRRGTFDFVNGGSWKDHEMYSEDPLIFSMDSTHFNSTASALPEEFTALTDEDKFIMVIPQDFSVTGLPVCVEFNIMDKETVLLEDRLNCKVYPKLRQGETYSICLDLTPVRITFLPSIAPWVSVEI